jgi:hypothetical protein
VKLLETIRRRRKPEPKFQGPTAAAALLNEIRPYNIKVAGYFHQHHPAAAVLSACRGVIPVEAIGAAESFREVLCKKTGWQQPLTFIELAEGAAKPERTDKTIDLGFIWRLFVVKYFPDCWVSPPTLTDFRNDVGIVQQAALYCPDVLVDVLRRMAEKYDDLRIVGEHYSSWTHLYPRMYWSWEKLLPEDSNEEEERNPPEDYRRNVDFDCLHILHEIEIHQQATSNRGATGNAVLAKVVEECWYQWRWAGRPSPLERGQFGFFQRFVLDCMALVAPPGVRQGSRNTIEKYIRSLAEEDECGTPPWRSGEENIPGSRKTEIVHGHSRTYFPRRREFFLQILRIRLKAYWNLIRGYPATWDNHDRIM